jgi:hypothetical protein
VSIATLFIIKFNDGTTSFVKYGLAGKKTNASPQSGVSTDFGR